MLNVGKFLGIRIRSLLFVIAFPIIAMVATSYQLNPIENTNGIEILAWLFTPKFSFPAFLILFSGTSLLVTDYFVQAKISGLNKSLAVRLHGFKHLLVTEFLSVFLYTFGLMVLTMIVSVVVIHFTQHPFVFTGSIHSEFLISSSPIISFLWLILTRAWGMAIFTMFVFAIGLWMARISLFRISGLLISLLMYNGVVLLARIAVLRIAGGLLFLQTLISPTGLSDFGPYLLPIPAAVMHLLSCVIYLGLTFVIAASWYRHEVMPK